MGCTGRSRAATRRAARRSATRPQYRSLPDTRTGPRLALEEGWARRAHDPEARARIRGLANGRVGRADPALARTAAAGDDRVGGSRGGEFAGPEPRPPAATTLRAAERAGRRVCDLDSTLRGRRDKELATGADPERRREAREAPGARPRLRRPARRSGGGARILSVGGRAGGKAQRCLFVEDARPGAAGRGRGRGACDCRRGRADADTGPGDRGGRAPGTTPAAHAPRRPYGGALPQWPGRSPGGRLRGRPRR